MSVQDGESGAAGAFWEEMSRPGAREVVIAGRRLSRGSRVRLRPRPGGDVLDAWLAGRLAVIEGLDQDDAGGTHVAVTLEDDPGRDLGEARFPAHRFFFTPTELEPVDGEEAQAAARRVLVAGIGNIFYGDDGFGVEVVRRLCEREMPAGVEVRDFGIRGMDLAYALSGPFDAVIMVDAVARGRAPGTVQLIEVDAAELGEGEGADPHQMNPLAVLRLAARIGPLPPRLLVVGCEPERCDMDAGCAGGTARLSTPVAAAVEQAAALVTELSERLCAGCEPVTDNQPGAPPGAQR